MAEVLARKPGKLFGAVGQFPSAAPATVPALVYHKVAPIPAGSAHPENYTTPEQFERHLAYLRRARFTPISFAEYVAHRNGKGTLPPRPILLTFDDGYLNTYAQVFPRLLAHGFTATVFVVAGMLGGTNSWD